MRDDHFVKLLAAVPRERRFLLLARIARILKRRAGKESRENG